MKNIIVAFSDHSTAQKIRTILSSNGIYVAGVCTSASQVIVLARRLQGSGLVICSNRLSDSTVDFAAEQLLPDYEFLLLIHGVPLSVYEGKGVYSLQLPLKKLDFLDTVKMLISVGQKQDISKITRQADSEISDKKMRTPEEIKLVNDAKDILMNRNNLTEEQAHRFLQKRSMDSGSRLIDTARAIIERW